MGKIRHFNRSCVFKHDFIAVPCIATLSAYMLNTFFNIPFMFCLTSYSQSLNIYLLRLDNQCSNYFLVIFAVSSFCMCITSKVMYHQQLITELEFRFHFSNLITQAYFRYDVDSMMSSLFQHYANIWAYVYFFLVTFNNMFRHISSDFIRLLGMIVIPLVSGIIR